MRVLLLVPEDFQRYVYVSTYEGREIRHPLGEEAVRELGPPLESNSLVLKSGR